MITTFTRFDLANLFGQPSRSVALLALIVAFGVLQPSQGIALMTAVLAISLTAATPFMADERGRLDTLYGLLPLGRRDVVVGRYLTMLAFAVVSLAVATLTTVGVSLARGQSLDWTVLGLAYPAALLIVAVALSVQLPVFFRLGFARARFMMFLPIVVFAAIFVVLTRLNVLSLNALAGLAALSPYVLVLGVVVISAVLLSLSAALSVRWYRARAL